MMMMMMMKYIDIIVEILFCNVCLLFSWPTFREILQ